MAPAGVLDSRPEFRRRRLDGRPAQRLGDQRRDVPLNLEHVVDVVGEALERLIVAEKTTREIERRQVLGAGSHGAKIAAEQGFAADADRVEIGAVERVPERQRLVPAGGVAREFQRHGNRRGAARGEQNLVEVARRGLNEAPRERRRGRIGETARTEGKAFHFTADRGDDLWVAVAELMDAVAVKIEDAPAVDVGQNRAFGAHDRRETRRRQRLAEEIALVLVERGARGVAERGAPFRPRRRDVDVAFGRWRTRVVHGRSPRASRSSIFCTIGVRSATLSMT